MNPNINLNINPHINVCNTLNYPNCYSNTLPQKY